MYKKIFIGLLIVTLGVAAAFSFFNAWAMEQAGTDSPAVSSQVTPPAGRGQGSQNAARQNSANAASGASGATGSLSQAGVPNPQNGLTEWVTYQGIVASYAPPSLVITTADGQTIAVELGSINYLNSLGLALNPGDSLTLTGFQDPNGGFAIGSLLLDATGQVYNLRDELGRPAWRGGNGKGGQGQGGQGQGGLGQGGQGQGGQGQGSRGQGGTH